MIDILQVGIVLFYMWKQSWSLGGIRHVESSLLTKDLALLRGGNGILGAQAQDNMM